MKKPPKTLNNNKKSNKFDLKKNWKKTAFIGMAGFLFFLSVGYGGLHFYQQKSASAYGKYIGYIPLKQGGAVHAYACKIYVPSSNSYRVRFSISNRTPVTIQGAVKLAGLTTNYVILKSTTPQYYLTAPSGSNGVWFSYSAYYGGEGGSAGGQIYFYNAPYPQTNYPNC